jgi:hypothetical protein
MQLLLDKGSLRLVGPNHFQLGAVWVIPNGDGTFRNKPVKQYRELPEDQSDAGLLALFKSIYPKYDVSWSE